MRDYPDKMTTAKKIIEYMESLRNEEQRKNLMRFFKTAPGEYGYGYEFFGHWLLLPTCLRGQDAGLHKDYKLHLLDELAASDNLWKQRMSIVCSWKTSQQGAPSWCLRYAEIHLHHPHDLMHKAVGWMLREMGKRVLMDLLRDFLRQHAHEMPRTMLRYAIEKMNEEERKQWMDVKVFSTKIPSY